MVTRYLKQAKEHVNNVRILWEHGVAATGCQYAQGIDGVTSHLTKQKAKPPSVICNPKTNYEQPEQPATTRKQYRNKIHKIDNCTQKSKQENSSKVAYQQKV